MPSDFRAIIQAQLNDESVENEVKAIGNKHKIVFNNISFDRTALSNAIQSALNGQNININLGNANFNTQNLASQARQAGIRAGQQFTSHFNRAINGIDLHNGGVGHVNGMLQQLGFDRQSLRVITEDLGNMKLQIDSIKTQMLSTGNIRVTVTGQDELQRYVQIQRDFNKETGNIVNTSKTFLQDFKQQEAQIQKNTAATMQYGDQLAKLNAKFTGEESKSRLFNETHVTEFNAALQNVYNTITQLETATAEQATVLKANISSQINAVNLLGQSFHDVEVAERSNEAQIQKNSIAFNRHSRELEKIKQLYLADDGAKLIHNDTNWGQVFNEIEKVEQIITQISNATNSNFSTLNDNADNAVRKLRNMAEGFASEEKQINKNKAAIEEYNAKINSLYNTAKDPNAAKPIVHSSNLETLKGKYDEICVAINGFNDADSNTFANVKAHVNAEILSFKSLVGELQRAENLASSLRSKPFETVKADELNKLREFMAIVKNSGISLDLFTKSRQALKEFLPSNTGIKGIEIVLKNATNAEQLTQYLNLFSNVKSEFKALQAEQQPVNQAYKDMLSLQEQINSKSAKVKSLDASKNVEEIKQLNNEIGTLESKYNELYDIFGGKLTSNQIDTLLNKLYELDDRLSMVNAKSVDATNIKQINAQYQETLSLISQISAKNSKMLSLNPEKDTQQIAELNVQIGNLWQRLMNLPNVNFSTEQINGINIAFQNLADNLSLSENRITDIQNNLVNTINGKISGGSINASIDQVQSKFNTLNSTISSLGAGANTDVLKAKLLEINTDLEQLNSLKAKFAEGGMDNAALISSYDSYNKILDRVKNNLKSVQIETKQFASATEVNIAINKMETWLRKNQKAAKTYGDEIRNLINRLKQMQAQGGVLPTELKNITNSFTEMKTAAAAAGLTGRTFFQQILGAAKSLGRYFGVSTLVYRTFGTIKNGIKDIVDLDTALVDLKKTTDGTEAQLNSFYYTANESAKKLGVTTKEIISAASDWSRLGYSLKDAETMAQVSAKFEAISPGVDMQKAQDGLVSAMKAFNIEANDALDGIASKINAIGNSQAVSNADIIEFLTRSSSAMKEANNTLEETIALGTAATEITRDASSVGNALKTKFYEIVFVYRNMHIEHI